MAYCVTVGNGVASMKFDCEDKDNHNVHLSTIFGGADFTINKSSSRTYDSDPSSIKYTTKTPSVFDIPTNDGKHRSAFSFM